MPEFKKEYYGAEVATILDTDRERLEVQRLSDGNFALIVHQWSPNFERWEDLSVILQSEHFIELGEIAALAGRDTGDG